MFTIDPKLTEKDLKGKNIFKVLISMNNHQVATPETSLEEARSYVFFFREGRNRFSAYIGLHLILTDRKLIYVNSANPFFEDDVLEVENEARDFAEYMGAMMDEVDLASMSDLEQESWIEGQGFFSTKKHTEAAATASASQPPAALEKPEPAAEAIRDFKTESSSVQPAVSEASSAQKKEQIREAPLMETVQQEVQVQPPPLAVTKLHKEIEKKEAKTGSETKLKQSEKKLSLSVTSVVSRDREALARLLTSF